MAQYDVLPPLDDHPSAPYLVVLQHDSIKDRGTTIVAPCIPFRAGPGNRRVTPEVEISGRPYVVVMGDMTSIELSLLSNRAVANLAPYRDAFTAAIDLLFTGI